MSDFLDELSLVDHRPVEDDREEEMSLGESRRPTVEERDAYDEQVAKFDLQDFINSIHTSQVTVRLYSRGDLEERISRLRHKQLEQFQRGDLIGQRETGKKIQNLIAEYHAQYLDVTLAEASKAQQALAVKEARAAGVTNRNHMTLWVIASQIVEPVEIDGPMLIAWSQEIPSQIRSLVKAWGQLQDLDVDGLPSF